MTRIELLYAIDGKMKMEILRTTSSNRDVRIPKSKAREWKWQPVCPIMKHGVPCSGGKALNPPGSPVRPSRKIDNATFPPDHVIKDGKEKFQNRFLTENLITR